MNMEYTNLIESLLQENNELLTQIYYAQLWCIGVVCSVFVLFLLYKFLRLFF